MGEPKKLSAAEVALHHSKKDCWISIHGKVYDVTTFLEDHPGGEEVLLHASGKATGDATRSFEDVGHSTTATSMMNSYEIGVLEGYTHHKHSEVTITEKEGLQQPSIVRVNSYSVMDYVMPILILVVAFGAWYYLTFVNVS